MNWNRLQTDESLPPLLKGVGLTIVVLATLIGIIHARHTPGLGLTKAIGKATSGQKTLAVGQDETLVELTREVSSIRTKLEEETTVVEVLVNPWFETFSLCGTAIFASSFYLEWRIKRPPRPAACARAVKREENDSPDVVRH
jgi:hypothetical protein